MISLVVTKARDGTRTTFQLIDREARDAALLKEQRDLQFGKDNWVDVFEQPVDFLSEREQRALCFMLKIDTLSAGSIAILSLLEATVRRAYEDARRGQPIITVPSENLPILYRNAYQFLEEIDQLSEGKIPALAVLSRLSLFGSQMPAID